jgi:Tim10/DDP family zinc finger
MGWFSGASDDSPPKSYDDTSSSSFAGSSGDAARFEGSHGGGGHGMADIRQFAENIQQQALVQSIITDMTREAMEKCVTGTPKDGKLTSSQVTCVHSCVNKWMDTNEFMNGRMAAKAQQANQGGMH